MKKIGLGLLIILMAVLFYVPNMVKNHILEHDLELIHRELIIDDVDINYLTGNVSLESIYLMEQNAKDTFAGFEVMNLNLGIWSSLMGEYTIESIALTNPMINIIAYDDSLYNYSDLLVDESPTENASEPISFYLGDITVKGLKAQYLSLNEQIAIEHVDLTLEPLGWDKKIIEGHVSLAPPEGGAVRSSFSTDIESGDYEASVNIDKLSLTQYSVLIRQYLNIKHVAGFYSNQLSIKGNFLRDKNLHINGQLDLTDFRLIDQYNLELAAFKELTIDIDTINFEDNEFHISGITLDQAFFDFSLFDDTNSLAALLLNEEQDSTTAFSDDATLIEEDNNNTILYSVSKFELTDGQVRFQDHTMMEYLDYSLHALQISVDSLNSERPQTVINTSALLGYRGTSNIIINYDLKDSRNIGYTAKLIDVPMVDFSPYSMQYIGSPINSGVLSFEGTVETTQHFLRSENMLLLDHLKLGDKVKHSERYKLPVKTAANMLKNPKGEIKIKLPVRGNLDDPSFKVWRTILNTLKNLVVKTVASPISAIGKAFTKADRDVYEVDYSYLQSRLTSEQKNTLKHISNRIKERKGQQAAIIQYTNPIKEKSLIAVYEAKKKYYVSSIDSVGFNQIISNQISPIDSGFQNFVNELTPQDSIMNLEERCAMIVGSDIIEGQFEKLVNQRNEEVKRLLRDNSGVLIETALFEVDQLETHRPVFKIRPY